MVAYLLRSPVEIGSEKIEKLEIREPTGDDIVACGYPFVIHSGGPVAAMQPDASVVAKYISRLAGVPPSTVGKLKPVDWQGCMQVVLLFFGDSATPSSTDTSTSLGSGT
ncbi:MAG: phage tail assembly protein [Rhodospirillales bacterium]|nr:phage tail assembly protein [Rhodospirillales bacterium]